MFGYMSCRVFVFLAVIGVMAGSRPVEAQVTTGEEVLTIDRAPVQQGKETILTVEKGTSLTATTVNGDWVGVKVQRDGQEVAGWIHTKYLAAAGDAVAESEPAADEYPRELSMRSLPAYRIEPPDVLQIELPRLVPLPPYRTQVFDVLQIQVLGSLIEQPIDGPYLVGTDGTINLGPSYGKVRVAGMTIDQTEQVLDRHLRQILKEPQLSVQLAQASGLQPVNGTYLVGPDGTINLRRYGTVHVAGKALVEAKLALERHLAQFLDNPEVLLNVASYNSKVYYVVIEQEGQGDRIVRVPITGNETVLDAISQVGGLPSPSETRIWIARPAPSGSALQTILPVDWEAITRRGSTETNYQIMPGDRLVIAKEMKADPTPLEEHPHESFRHFDTRWQRWPGEDMLLPTPVLPIGPPEASILPPDTRIQIEEAGPGLPTVLPVPLESLPEETLPAFPLPPIESRELLPLEPDLPPNP